MKIKFILTLSVFLVIFCLSFLGVRLSTERLNIAGKHADITLVTLGNQALAYCNEATFPGEFNNGRCTGSFNDSSTRCLQPTSITDPVSCIRGT